MHLLIERAAGAVVLCATGFPAERRTAWGVVRRLPAGRPGPALRESAAEGAPRREDMQALRAAPHAMSEAGPLVLCVDDVHHADAESLAFAGNRDDRSGLEPGAGGDRPTGESLRSSTSPQRGRAAPDDGAPHASGSAGAAICRPACPCPVCPRTARPRWPAGPDDVHGAGCDHDFLR